MACFDDIPEDLQESYPCPMAPACKGTVTKQENGAWECDTCGWGSRGNDRTATAPEGEPQRWVKEATEVLTRIQLQEVGKEIGVRLGQDIASAILPAIRALKADKARLLAEVESLLRSASPHPQDHPAMHRAWVQAHATLADLSHPIPNQHRS